MSFRIGDIVQFTVGQSDNYEVVLVKAGDTLVLSNISGELDPSHHFEYHFEVLAESVIRIVTIT